MKIVKKDTTKSTVIRLNPIEQATMNGMSAVIQAAINEREAYFTTVVCGRIGIHRTRISGVDVSTGIITLAPDAPKAAETKKD